MKTTKVLYYFLHTSELSREVKIFCKLKHKKLDYLVYLPNTLEQFLKSLYDLIESVLHQIIVHINTFTSPSLLSACLKKYA